MNESRSVNGRFVFHRIKKFGFKNKSEDFKKSGKFSIQKSMKIENTKFEVSLISALEIFPIFHEKIIFSTFQTRIFFQILFFYLVKNKRTVHRSRFIHFCSFYSNSFLQFLFRKCYT